MVIVANEQEALIMETNEHEALVMETKDIELLQWKLSKERQAWAKKARQLEALSMEAKVNIIHKSLSFHV